MPQTWVNLMHLMPLSFYHTQNVTVQDDHIYYTSVYHPPGDTADRLWVDVSGLPDSEEVNLTTFTLSNNYRFFAVSVSHSSMD